MSLKYFGNFWRTLGMPLFNFEIDVSLTWSANCVISPGTAVNQATAYEITNTKTYVPVITRSIQHNAKLLQKLNSSSKKTINWNKYQSKASIERQNQYLDYLIDPSFPGVNVISCFVIFT